MGEVEETKALEQKKAKKPTERLTYRITEVIDTLGVSRSKVFDMIRDGELPVIKLGGCTLIRREVLEALLERHTHRAA
ncbi:MAG: helix-turn-helix domain-containing protein [Caulobacteraceae bacterium]